MVPYSAEHKQQTRSKIVEAARILFNRHGFENVTIDAIMQSAGLTRGGFYNHFDSKEELFAEAIACFLMGRGAQWRADAKVGPSNAHEDVIMGMIMSYLSTEHLDDLDGQCPLIALPSDVARASQNVRQSYQKLLEAMVWRFKQGLSARGETCRTNALSLAALCIGGMTLARTLPDSALADEIRLAALAAANSAVEA